MGDKIVIGPVNRGLKNDRTAFVIDNDAFPTLINAYQWRGRIKRKRGTSLLGRLLRFFDSTSTAYSSTSTINLSAGDKTANILTGFSLQTNGNIVPGSVTIVDTTAGNTYTDPASDGVLVGNPVGSGTINYGSGLVFLNVLGPHAISATFNYYPSLPVMGLEDFASASSQFPGSLGFDTVYAYNMLTTSPYSIYSISFYKNPQSALYTGYTRKTVSTPVAWNGQDYQQTWSTNYQGALWMTNGINIPFSTSNIGMQYKAITNLVITAAGPAATATLTIANHGLSVGDFLFINEIGGFVATTSPNYQTCYVVAPTIDANNVNVEFPNATLVGAYTSGGIAQYLTNRSDTTKDCIRFYDGDPTDGNATTPSLSGFKGWVNFCPPLNNIVLFPNFSVGGLAPAQYYLVGARMIVPFKDRLLFVGPVVQTSASGSQVYLQDTVIYSQNGTGFYTASFTGDPSLSTTVFNPILQPTDQTATPTSYWEDQTGFGGFISAGLDQPITTVSANEDALIMGLLPTYQTRLIYTSNDILPFNFLLVNSELGSSSTFSTINMDKAVLTRGSRGFVMTSQNEARRFDLDIPDEVFRMNLTNNGTERICAQRDYISEWIYFTYPVNDITYKYPNQTLQYNYRDESWAIFNECYTTYGLFRKQTGYTWATVGTIYPTWDSWNDPWNAGTTTLLQPQVTGGNQQGFVVIRDDGTNEATSITVNNISFATAITGATQANPCVLTCASTFVPGQTVKISGVAGMTQLNGNTYTITAVTLSTVSISVNATAFTAYTSGGIATPTGMIYSPNHCLNAGDYITFEGILGTSSASFNEKIFSVANPTSTEFNLSAASIPTSGTYIGSGTIKRMYVPFVQTKQFPMAWEMGRKTRIGFQQYLLTTTPNSQITLLIYLSQNSSSAYNDGQIFPLPNAQNNGLIYSTVLYTCTESSNLGLTPANTNLQMNSEINNSGTNASSPQSQTWHRINTSLIGDTVQLGFTMSDDQMRDSSFMNQFAEIELHGFIIDASPSSVLS